MDKAKIKEIQKRQNLLLSADKKITILSYGNFNPFGSHAPRTIQNTIAKLSKACENKFNYDFSRIKIIRYGLWINLISIHFSF